MNGYTEPRAFDVEFQVKHRGACPVCSTPQQIHKHGRGQCPPPREIPYVFKARGGA